MRVSSSTSSASTAASRKAMWANRRVAHRDQVDAFADAQPNHRIDRLAKSINECVDILDRRVDARFGVAGAVDGEGCERSRSESTRAALVKGRQAEVLGEATKAASRRP